METRTNNYTVSPETAGYLDALRAWEQFKESLFDAITSQYRESATDIYTAASPQLEAVDKVVCDFLTDCIKETYGIKSNPRNTI